MSECPNCGNTDPPEKVVHYFADATITYYNCKHCDFSTWEQKEWDRSIGVRGHWKVLSDGKRVWINPYRKEIKA